MTLVINGEEIEVPEHVSSVEKVLHYFSIDQKVAIVEVNQSIIEKSAHSEKALTNGDRVEIVHFVGGG